MGRMTRSGPVLRLTGETVRRRPDTLVVEEPLEIRVAGRPFVVTMRTPGHDVELALGFLVGEGVVSAPEHVRRAERCGLDGAREAVASGADPSDVVAARELADNVLEVDLAAGVARPEASLERSVYTSSSCGVCGTASIDGVRKASAFAVRDDPLVVAAEVLAALPDRLRDAQKVFARTGGLHAVGLFDASGALVCVREDVGRHNAFDKVVGWALQQGRLPLAGHVVLVSGRASFELVQKAWTAGVPLLAAVSAPSSLAVDLADEAGMTLVGFLRGETMNVYAGGRRVGAGRREVRG